MFDAVIGILAPALGIGAAVGWWFSRRYIDRLEKKLDRERMINAHYETWIQSIDEKLSGVNLESPPWAAGLIRHELGQLIYLQTMGLLPDEEPPF